MYDGQRIVFAATGSLGDVNPFFAVALEAKRRGWRVLLLAAPEYAAKAAAADLPFFPMRPGWDDIRPQLGLTRGAFIDRCAADREFLLRQLVIPVAESAAHAIRTVIADADLVVVHQLAIAAQLAAELEQRPLVVLAVEPFFIFSTFDPPCLGPIPWLPMIRRTFGPAAVRGVLLLVTALAVGGASSRRLARVRRRLALPRVATHWVQSGVRNAIATICVWSPVLGRLQPDFPRQSVMAGSLIYDDEPDIVDDSKLTAFLEAGAPPVLLTLGAVAGLSPGRFYACGVAAARRLGLRVVIAAGVTPLAEVKSLAGPDVFVAGFVRYSRLFPRACMAVHHGGIAACHHGLRNGIPQLLAPLLDDQFDNACRLNALGAARTVPLRRWTAERAHDAMAALCTETVRARAMKLGRLTRSERGATAAVDFLEQLLSQRPEAAR